MFASVVIQAITSSVIPAKVGTYLREASYFPQVGPGFRRDDEINWDDL